MSNSLYFVQTPFLFKPCFNSGFLSKQGHTKQMGTTPQDMQDDIYGLVRDELSQVDDVEMESALTLEMPPALAAAALERFNAHLRKV